MGQRGVSVLLSGISKMRGQVEACGEVQGNDLEFLGLFAAFPPKVRREMRFSCGVQIGARGRGKGRLRCTKGSTY